MNIIRVIVVLLFFVVKGFSQNTVCFDIQSNPSQFDPALQGFTKYVNVLDCFNIYAEPTISDAKVLHVASVAAELLDNDEDGNVDDRLLEEELKQRGALIPILSSEWSQAADNFFDYYTGQGASAVLFNNEIDPTNTGQWGDDATVEEVLHVINHIGHVHIYPDIFDIDPNSSQMSDAMDIARGGQFINVPNNYPPGAWYHYDDWTCDYGCMAIEYMYWCIVTNMGILNDIQTCNGIANEWEPCSPELFESTDLLMHAIVTNPEHMLPQIAPDGNYCPSSTVLGDINDDGVVNILDVILSINIVLGLSDYNLLSDINEDGIVNILDIVLIVNIVLANR